MASTGQRLDVALGALAAIAGKPADQRAWCEKRAGKRQPVADRALRQYVARVALERLTRPSAEREDRTDAAAAVWVVTYHDGECAEIVAVFTTEALARAFWLALPEGLWGSYVLCREHCDVRGYPLRDALPDLARYAGKRPPIGAGA